MIKECYEFLAVLDKRGSALSAMELAFIEWYHNYENGEGLTESGRKRVETIKQYLSLIEGELEAIKMDGVTYTEEKQAHIDEDCPPDIIAAPMCPLIDSQRKGGLYCKGNCPRCGWYRTKKAK